MGGRRPSVLQRWGAGVLPRRFPVALKALPEPWQEKICDDARHGVSKFIIAAAIDGTYKDLIVICEWLLTTRQEYFALTVEGIATIVLKNGKKIFEYSNGAMEQWSNGAMEQCSNAAMQQCSNAAMQQCSNAG
ncbi:hypothetical protein LAW58_22895 [Escherichia coli]|nr:hypothetical protein [Escherichia coli]